MKVPKSGRRNRKRSSRGPNSRLRRLRNPISRRCRGQHGIEVNKSVENSLRDIINFKKVKRLAKRSKSQTMNVNNGVNIKKKRKLEKKNKSEENLQRMDDKSIIILDEDDEDVPNNENKFDISIEIINPDTINIPKSNIVILETPDDHTKKILPFQIDISKHFKANEVPLYNKINVYNNFDQKTMYIKDLSSQNELQLNKRPNTETIQCRKLDDINHRKETNKDERNSSDLNLSVSIIDVDSNNTNNDVNIIDLSECGTEQEGQQDVQLDSKDDVILLDTTPTPLKCASGKSNSQCLDDSVIFVSEQMNVVNPYSAMNLSNKLVPHSFQLSKTNQDKSSKSLLNTIIQPFMKLKNPLQLLYDTNNIDATPQKKHIRRQLFTASEHKKIKEYNANTYNPNKEIKKSGKRMIIIDGSNVAFSHALNKEFSVKGLEICLKYFEKNGHEVKAVVPQFRLQKNKSSRPERLMQLHQEGKIVFTPCKNLPGMSAMSYDDRFILQLAVEFDAAIVSNDNYRDLINENSAFRKVIENRVIGYTWCNDMFILPKDPYGQIGPTLSVILNRI